MKGLSLLAVRLNVHVLQALADGKLSLSSLSRAVGHPPATTMRSYLRSLEELGAIERQREAGFPGEVSYAITEGGTNLLAVEAALQRWLDLAPDGPISISSRAAKAAIGALVEGWSSGIVRALAARPFTLTELSKLIPGISYPALERRLTAMRRVGQTSARRTGAARGTPYSVTDWLRHSVAPITASIEWEHSGQPANAIRRIDVEASLLLTIPLLELDASTTGSCRLAVEMRNGGGDHDYAGAMVSLEEGRPVSYSARLNGEAGAWATGSTTDWLLWFNGKDDTRVEFGGDTSLAIALAESLRSPRTAERPLVASE
ncbi:MAG TPA: winged helix-turn-helix transcriptional regulator [Solirubrobacterales bacterium]|nr:winged helix-turn-helix transcriptional regulator [Solirubrobacterales bacterium]